jgi:hypothetical protein
MKSLRRIFWGLAFLSQSLHLHAARDAGLPGEFLNDTQGPRPLGMGTAFTAVSDDIDAFFWNPAGIASYRSNQVGLNHSPLPLDGALSQILYSQPLFALGNVGLGVSNAASGPVGRVASGSLISNNSFVENGSFQDRETAYALAYARRIGTAWNVGGLFKSVEHVIDGQSVQGYGADVGVLVKPFSNWRFGVVGRNLLQPRYTFTTETETFPRLVKVGGAVTFLDNRVLVAADAAKTVGQAQNPRLALGIEGEAIPNLFLRAGYRDNGPSAGMGIRWSRYQLDYAADFQDIGFVNHLGLKAFFGGYEADVKANPRVFSPVGLKNKTTFRIISTHRYRIVRWVLSVRNPQGAVMRSFEGYNAPPAYLEWDGRDAAGRLVAPGAYTFRITITDTNNHTETTNPKTVRIIAPTPFEMEAR